MLSKSSSNISEPKSRKTRLSASCSSDAMIGSTSNLSISSRGAKQRSYSASNVERKSNYGNNNLSGGGSANAKCHQRSATIDCGTATRYATILSAEEADRLLYYKQQHKHEHKHAIKQRSLNGNGNGSHGNNNTNNIITSSRHQHHHHRDNSGQHQRHHRREKTFKV
ncbi:sex determination protein fruitless-like [Condylostylus longicornis]|uniref:sex determination protein fruitless-like n=1 Tax=Condylostylus longicornis TaxID=2530218 RepID=UPI00244E2F8B|nr:sex determination protein fruitless-like [Condylostylus longicornis]